MRIACLTTALALLTSLALGGAGAAPTKPQPRLRVTALAPVKVHGSFFRTRERVRLVAETTEQQRSRVVRASRLGSFTVRFDTLYVHPCSSDLSIAAFGAQGSRADVKVGPPADCPPPP